MSAGHDRPSLSVSAGEPRARSGFLRAAAGRVTMAARPGNTSSVKARYFAVEERFLAVIPTGMASGRLPVGTRSHRRPQT